MKFFIKICFISSFCAWVPKEELYKLIDQGMKLADPMASDQSLAREFEKQAAANPSSMDEALKHFKDVPKIDLYDAMKIIKQQ